MWCNAAWLAYPKLRDDPARRVHSAPADVDAFADGLATLMEHLLKKRGYTCIKWLCINNEPDCGSSWWRGPGNKPLSIYFCLGLLSRFTAKHSAVLGSRVEGGRLADWQRVCCAALRSPHGNLTLAVVNDAPLEFDLKLAVRGLTQPTRLWRYRFGEAERDRADVKVDPQKEFSPGPAMDGLPDKLPPNSLTIYSTYNLAHDARGVIAE